MFIIPVLLDDGVDAWDFVHLNRPGDRDSHRGSDSHVSIAPNPRTTPPLANNDPTIQVERICPDDSYGTITALRLAFSSDQLWSSDSGLHRSGCIEIC